MKILYIISIAVFGLLFINCGSKCGPDLSPEASRKTVKNLPYWYLNTPVKEDFTYQATGAHREPLFCNVFLVEVYSQPNHIYPN